MTQPRSRSGAGELLLAGALASSAESVIIVDRAGRLVFINEAARQLLGQDFSLAEPLLDQIPDGVLRGRDGRPMPREETPLALALRGESTFDRELRIRRRDGREVVVTSTVTPVRDEHGAITGAVALFHDITDRRRAEEARAQLAVEQAARAKAEAAREALERFRLLYETVDAGVIVQNAAGRIVDANGRAQEILRRSLEELRGSTTRELHRGAVQADGSPMPEERYPTLVALETGQSVREAVIGLDLPSGERRWLLVNAAPQIDPRSGAVCGAVATFLDITRHRLAEQFREEYVSLVSHDLRTPLGVILSHAQLLKSRLREGQATVGLEAIETNCRRMNAMLTELVESARLEAAPLELQPEPLSLRQLVEDTVAKAVPPEERRRIRLEAGAEDLSVLGEAERLERVVINLLMNALKFSPPEQPVVLDVSRRGNEAVLSVADQGQGIAPQDLPRIFDRFYRAKSAPRRDGLGLGLYISRLIVHAHGGRIWAESHPGEGSTFYVALPLA